jgi:hypothetical protein
MSKAVTVQPSPVPRGTERAQAPAALHGWCGRAWSIVPGGEVDLRRLSESCERYRLAELKVFGFPLAAVMQHRTSDIGVRCAERSIPSTAALEPDHGPAGRDLAGSGTISGDDV